MGANVDSLYNYLKQIRLVYEDLRKEYPNDENLDKVCPMWVHFEIPRNYSQKNGGLLSGKVDVKILDAKDGTTLANIKEIKQINHLRNALNLLPNNTEIVVSLRADKNTPMEEVTKIKQALRESYIFKLNYETNK